MKAHYYTYQELTNIKKCLYFFELTKKLIESSSYRKTAPYLIKNFVWFFAYSCLITPRIIATKVCLYVCNQNSVLCFSLLTETTQLTSDEKLLTKAKIMQNIVLTMDNVHTSVQQKSGFGIGNKNFFNVFFIICF